MTMWREVKTRYKSALSNFSGGINTFLGPFDINDTDLYDAKDISSSNFPSISNRKYNGLYFTSSSYFASSNVDGFGIRDSTTFVAMAENTWYYKSVSSSTVWTTLTTSVASAGANLGTFIDFAKEDGVKTLWLSTETGLEWDGTTAVPQSMSTDCPKSDIVTVHNGRVFIAKDRTLHFSALLKSTDWTTADDAGYIPIVNARGPIVGIKEYADHVVILAKYSMHELYGSTPDDFTIVDVSNEVGCVNKQTVAEVRGKLFWLGYDGVYSYVSGGRPTNINQRISRYFNGLDPKDFEDTVTGTPERGACGISFEGRYRLAIGSPGFNPEEFVYDADSNVWERNESYFSFDQYLSSYDSLFFRAKNVLYEMNTTRALDPYDNWIYWGAATKLFNDGGIENKTLQSIDIIYKLSTAPSAGSNSLSLSYTTEEPLVDSTGWTSIATSLGSTVFVDDGTIRTTRIIVPMNSGLQRTKIYAFKFSGRGKCTVYSYQRNFRVQGR